MTSLPVMKSFFQIVLLRLDLASSNSCFHFHSASKASGKGTESDLWVIICFLFQATAASWALHDQHVGLCYRWGLLSPLPVAMDHPHWRACVFCVISSLIMWSSLGYNARKWMLSYPEWRYICRRYHRRPESRRGWILWIVTWLPIHLQHFSKNSIVQPALLEELVAGERGGNRSWNTPQGFVHWDESFPVSMFASQSIC